MKYTDEQVEAIVRERDELRAQFAEMASLADSLAFSPSKGEADDIAQKISALVHDEGEALSRRDARMKAEVLEECDADIMGIEVYQLGWRTEMCSHLKRKAAKYRKQAEGIDS